MSGDVADADRELIEGALRLVWPLAPPGWTRLVVQFEAAAHPPLSHAYALTPEHGSHGVPVPDAATASLAEYHRRSLARGAGWGRLTIECDPAGNISIGTASRAPWGPSGPMPGAGAVQPADSGPPSPVQRAARRQWWVSGAVAAVSVVVLAIALIGRNDDGATLRAMAADESMPDEQARAVAENTVRVWMRERNARNLPNLKALTCPDSRSGAVGQEIENIQTGKPTRAHNVEATGAFHRDGAVWTLNTVFTSGGAMFTMEIRDGQLRVCQFDSAPVP